MASPDGTGYLIPENPTPNELNCLLVFYPDDPMYLQALLGSLTYLGTWTAWERDATKRGRLAAAAWKDANDCTFDAMGCLTELVSALTGINQTLAAIQAAIENQELAVDTGDLVLAVNGVQAAIESQQISLDAGDLLPALTGIQTAIENQEITCNCGAGGEGDDMVINNNLCCGGCGCGGANQPSPVPPPDLPPEDTTPPQPDIPPYEEPPPFYAPYFEQFVCNYSHYLYFKFRLLVLELGNLIAIGEANYGRVVELIGASSASIAWYHAVAWGAWYSIVSYAVNVFTNLTASAMVQEMDRHHEEFVCGLFSGDGAEEKRNNWLSVIDSLALAWPARYWLKLLTQNIDWSYFYTPDWQSVVFPPSFQNRRCCGQLFDDIPALPDLPELEEGFRWVLEPVEYDVVAYTNEPTTFVTEDRGIGNGHLGKAHLIRTGQWNNSLMRVNVAGLSRYDLDGKYGENKHFFAGWILETGDISWSPLAPSCTIGIQSGVNVLLAGTQPLTPHTKHAILVEGETGDEAEDFLDQQGYECQRKADSNLYGGAGDTKPTIENLVSTPDGSWTPYDVSWRFTAGYQLFKVIDAP